MRLTPQNGWVCQAYKFALDPTPGQEQLLRSHAGAHRYAWNRGLAWCLQRYASERKWYSAGELHRMWSAQKKADPELAWWSQNSKCVYQEAFRDLDRALRDYAKSRRGERKGRRLGFPRPKKRGKCKDSFRFSTGVMRCAGTTVTSPRLGRIGTHESTRKLARRLEVRTARVLSATVPRAAARWFVSFQVEVQRAVPGQHARPGSAAGVDLGVRTLPTGVADTGEVIEIEGPKALAASLARLRRASRRHSRRAHGSANRTKAAERLARVHARVASVRTDALHKATTRLARKYETVVAEDLYVTGMLANRRLARALADQGFGTARRMLEYKTAWCGGRLVTADRWYPSSKTCSRCGWRKPSLTLSERTFTCAACDLVLGRDVNAAINLLKPSTGTASGAGTGSGDGTNACGAGVRPASGGHRARNQEPGIPAMGTRPGPLPGNRQLQVHTLTRAHPFGTDRGHNPAHPRRPPRTAPALRQPGTG
jgi:putative transposase